MERKASVSVRSRSHTGKNLLEPYQPTSKSDYHVPVPATVCFQGARLGFIVLGLWGYESAVSELIGSTGRAKVIIENDPMQRRVRRPMSNAGAKHLVVLIPGTFELGRVRLPTWAEDASLLVQQLR